MGVGALIVLTLIFWLLLEYRRARRQKVNP
jgi:hypothetical protein